MKILWILLTISMNALYGQVIQISQEQQNNLGIKVQKAKAIKSMDLGPFSAKVILDKKDIISIGSNVDAEIREIYVRELDRVKKGQKLLSLRSNKLLALQEKYIRALIQSEKIDQDYQRDLRLKKEGVVSKKKYATSLALKRNNALTITLSENELLGSGLSAEMLQRIKQNHQPIMQINLLAPRDGVIDGIFVNIGETVESNKVMMRVYANAKRFIQMNLALRVIKNISIGESCYFSNYEAKISTISSVVESQTQSVEVRATVENTKDLMLNRIYLATIHKPLKNVLKIQKSALVFEKNKTYVFKKVDKGFEVIEVFIVDEGPSYYLVKASLKEQDSLAINATSALLGAMEVSDE